MTAGAIRDTAGILHERLVAIAAHRLEAAPDDIEVVGGRIHVKGTPAIAVTLADVAAAALRTGGEARGTAKIDEAIRVADVVVEDRDKSCIACRRHVRGPRKGISTLEITGPPTT